MNEAIRPGQGTQAVVTPELSVVVPTFNERDNVIALFRKLETALAGRAGCQGAGGAGGPAVGLMRRFSAPLAERPDRPYLVWNGDVDAS